MKIFSCALVVLCTVMYFQKISIPPPWKGFFLRSPTPLEIPVNLHIHVSLQTFW